MADTPKTRKDPETPVHYKIGHYKLPSVDDIEAGVVEFKAVDNDALVDIEALVASQKKSVEALIAANRIAVEGMQRQVEVLLVYQESTKEAQQAVSSMTTVSSQEQELFAEKILDDLIVRADRVNDQLDRSIDHIARVRANIAELSRRSADLAVEDTPK